MPRPVGYALACGLFPLPVGYAPTCGLCPYLWVVPLPAARGKIFVAPPELSRKIGKIDQDFLWEFITGYLNYIFIQ